MSLLKIEMHVEIMSKVDAKTTTGIQTDGQTDITKLFCTKQNTYIFFFTLNVIKRTLKHFQCHKDSKTVLRFEIS